MFSQADDASKIALVHLVARLRAGGFTLLDSQFVTDHLRQFGATEVPRDRYREMLARAIATPAKFYDGDDDSAAVSELLQACTQMS